MNNEGCSGCLVLVIGFILVVLLIDYTEFFFIFIGICIFTGLMAWLLNSIGKKQKKKDDLDKLNQREIQILKSFILQLSTYTNNRVQITEEFDELLRLAQIEYNKYTGSCTVAESVQRKYDDFYNEFFTIKKNTDIYFTNQSLSSQKYMKDIYLNRELIKYEGNKGVLSLNFFIDCVTLGYNDDFLIFLPYFIILIKGEQVFFKDWSEIILKKPLPLRVEETKLFKIRGSIPTYYRYLHERVDGGPDRRYNYNPSTPVYTYSMLEWKLSQQGTLLMANWDLANLFFTVINEYKQAVKVNPIQYKEKNEVENYEVSNDEIASLFRQLVNEHGKEILFEPRFLFMLDDYKITREKKAIKSIFYSLSKENMQDLILSPNISFDKMDVIYTKLKNSNLYTDKELLETLAYIGYGLQIS